MKFGGTSVGNAQIIRDVGTLVKKAAAQEPVGLVVSAVTGVTDHLISSVVEVLKGDSPENFTRRFIDIHAEIVAQLFGQFGESCFRKAQTEIGQAIREYENLLTGVQLLQECSPSILDHICSLGERVSVQIMAGVLDGLGLNVKMIDPRECIFTDSVFGNASPCMPEIEKRFEPYRSTPFQILLMPGFFGADKAGKTTTLGRGGSDFSAAIMAAALKADSLEIWTDVDGVFSADPRLVPDAFVLEEMSYPEAMELAFFGAKVLHPRTIAPVVSLGIPTIIKNTFRPEQPGTLIHECVESSRRTVRGLSALAQVAMIGISGAGLRGVPGVAARVFSAMAREGISVILITQASSEYSICFCVSEGQALKAADTLEAEFALERKAGMVDPIEVVRGLSIVSVVGDQMKSRRGLAGTFFGGLASADVNVVAIAQGFSERNISAVVTGTDAERALRVTHQFFFNTRQGIQVFLVGAGSVGGHLLEQIKLQQSRLSDQQIDLRVCGIAGSRVSLLQFDGIDLRSWKDSLKAASQSFDLKDFIRQIQEARLLNPVFVDCTGSREIAESYLCIFEAGMHLVTPNKKANAGSRNYYLELRRVANRRKRKFLYETNVGAGLPIIETLQNMIKSGDRVRCLNGILSGSLSYIFSRLEDGIPFSQAVADARVKGFTEPDPREDLSGTDVARKILILSREMGMKWELKDITINSPLPSGFDSSGTTEEFMQRCRELDDYFAKRVSDLRSRHCALRFVGNISGETNRVGLEEISVSDPLYQVRDGENAVSFLTDRYKPIPLLVRGYGAGPAVTAAGVFADILKTVFWNAEEPE